MFYILTLANLNFFFFANSIIKSLKMFRFIRNLLSTKKSTKNVRSKRRIRVTIYRRNTSNKIMKKKFAQKTMKRKIPKKGKMMIFDNNVLRRKNIRKKIGNRQTRKENEKTWISKFTPFVFRIKAIIIDIFSRIRSFSFL